MTIRSFVKPFEKSNCKDLEVFDRIKLLSPISSLIVKFKTRLKACIYGLNFLSNLARGGASAPWLRL